MDGARSAGGQAQHQKNNLQLSQASELSAQLQAKVKAAVHRSALFFSAALPRRIFNPLFNNYGDSANYYGNHVDSAVMHSKADGCWVRSDLSCTLFLTAPEDYDGGELVIAQALARKAHQAACGRFDPLPQQHRAPGLARHTRAPHLQLLLGGEHGAWAGATPVAV